MTTKEEALAAYRALKPIEREGMVAEGRYNLVVSMYPEVVTKGLTKALLSLTKQARGDYAALVSAYHAGDWDEVMCCCRSAGSTLVQLKALHESVIDRATS